MTATEDLIKMFNLQKEVAQFVQCRVEWLVTNKQCFSFEGSHSRCSNPNPHVPHVRDIYNTVRYGDLERYCLGKEGNRIHIEIRKSTNGNPDTPAYTNGFWFMEE